MCAHKDADCPAGLKGGKLETTGASINRGFVTPRFGVSVLKQAYCIGTGKSTNHLENRQAVQLWEGGGGFGTRVPAATPVGKGRAGPALAAVGGSGKGVEGTLQPPSLCCLTLSTRMCS